MANPPKFTQNWANALLGSIHSCYPNGIPKDKPLTCLEIGAFEGRGSLIIADTLCSHPDSKVLCVDPWDDAYVNGFKKFEELDRFFIGQFARFQENTSCNPKIKALRGSSNSIIPTLSDSIDFAYIDGDHSPEQVYKDACITFEKLAAGAFMVFDDYEWVHNGLRCGDGVDRFISEYKDKVRIVFITYQLGIQKLS